MFQKITLSEVLSLLCNDFCAILERQSPYNVLNYCSSVDHHSCAQLEQRPETSPPVSETLQICWRVETETSLNKPFRLDMTCPLNSLNTTQIRKSVKCLKWEGPDTWRIYNIYIHWKQNISNACSIVNLFLYYLLINSKQKNYFENIPAEVLTLRICPA